MPSSALLTSLLAWSSAAYAVDVDLQVLGPLVRGEPTEVLVTLTPPLDDVLVELVLGLGGIGDGPCPSALGGACLDVLPPLENPDAAVTSGGAATLWVVPPFDAPGTVALQAFTQEAVPSVSEPLELPVGAATWGLTLTPRRARVGVDDLRCQVHGISPSQVDLRWEVDGRPMPEVTRGLHVLPAGRLAAGRTYTCVAERNGVAQRVRSHIRVPSVLVLLADDLGWGDVGAFGEGPAADTPRLDQLADEGVRFDQAYASAPMCGPSRAGLITGRQQQRFGFEYNPEGGRDRGLPTRETTLGEVLGTRVRTAFIGKWHLGDEPRFEPRQRGFDDFVGFLGGKQLSLDPSRPHVLTRWLRPADLTQWASTDLVDQVQRNGRPAEWDGQQHLTDFLADAAIAQITSSNRPFFTLVSFNAPHIPIQAPAEHLMLVANPSSDAETLAYQATVAGLDAAIGRILDAVAASPHGDDTLVVFLSDNGCPTALLGACSNDPLTGGKLLLTEGGLRVPMMLSWPDRLTQRVVHDPVSTLDLLPTLAGALDVDTTRLPALDGVNLLPFLAGSRVGEPPHDALAWRVGGIRAVRRGPYKLVEHVTERIRWLFDIDNDPEEQVNLAAALPDVVDELHELLEQRELRYMQPAWEGETEVRDYYGTDVVVWH
jgi:arylsulfatase A-like enzyme